MGSRAARAVIPETIEGAEILPRASYEYACAHGATAPPTRSAEWWAREVFEGAPPLLRRLLVLGWRFGLGLRLAPPAPASNVMGWAIVTSEPAKAVLGVGSRWLTARLVALVEDDRVVHITLVRFDRAPARQLWMLAKPIHELVIPILLTRAAARAQGRARR